MPSSFNSETNKWEHHIRQSDLVRFGQCAESHRRHLIDPETALEGDASAVGSAAHAAYAWATQRLAEGHTAPQQEASSIGVNELVDLWRTAEATGNFRQMQIASLDDGIYLVAQAVELWYQEVLPHILSNIENVNAVEKQFDILVYSDKHRDVYLQGTYDLGIAMSVVDYKHSNSDKYTSKKKWQLDRYHPQPIHYCWAVDQLLMDETDGSKTLEYPHSYNLATDFSFININPHKGTVDWLPLESKTVGDCFFHLQVIKGLVMQIEGGTDEVWPLGATDWWCSSKWCDHWKDCRGKYIGDDPWGLLEKVEINLSKKRGE